MALLLACLLVAFELPEVERGTLLTIHGHAVQGGLLRGRAPAGAEVMVDGEPALVDGTGLFLAGIDRDRTDPVRIRVRHDGVEQEALIAIEPRIFDVQRIDGLPPAQVTPPPEVLARIQREAALVGRARTRRDLRQDFEEGFVWPARGRISGVYGSQRILNGEPRRPHFGVDVAAPAGAPVTAPAGGVVTLAEPDLYYSGGTIILDHGLGLSSTFLHLSEVTVAVGDRVAQGELIGRVGATGRATGPHLDWRMNAGAVRIDPQLLVTGRPDQP